MFHENFNPRSREGSDILYCHRVTHAHISIHAPVKGATRLFTRRCKPEMYFNPRSREGSDRRGQVLAVSRPRFQSTLP